LRRADNANSHRASDIIKEVAEHEESPKKQSATKLKEESPKKESP
jgi:hypothetical protein